MSELWLPLVDIPVEGREFLFSDPALLTGPWKEYGLEYAMAEPVETRLHISLHGGGCMIRGEMKGLLTTPCDRCARDASVVLDHSFDEYEDLPPEEPEHGQGKRSKSSKEPEREPREDDLERTLLRRNGEVVELDVAGLIWEQFVLFAPAKPLCREDCAGLCPECGADLNTAPCECDRDDLDPRMAVLRGLKIDR